MSSASSAVRGRISTLEIRRVACAGARVRYVAVRGGIDAPRVLGGRGTLLGAGLGGHDGRGLRPGDVLRVGDAAATPWGRGLPAAPSSDAAIRVLLGPDLDRDIGVTLEIVIPGGVVLVAGFGRDDEERVPVRRVEQR